LNGVLDSAEYLQEHFPGFYPTFLEGIRDNQFDLYKNQDPQVNNMLFPGFEGVGTGMGSPWWNLIGVLVQQHTRCAVTYAFGRVGCTVEREWTRGGYTSFVDDVVARVLTQRVMNQIQMRETVYNTSKENGECFGEIVAEQCNVVNITIAFSMRIVEFMDRFSTVNEDGDEDEDEEEDED
jgi:hypothetical protein